MAALLMKHVEKEKKKILSATHSSSSSSALNASRSSISSSSVKAHVRTFHTQKGQYTVHFMPPGQSIRMSYMQAK